MEHTQVCYPHPVLLIFLLIEFLLLGDVKDI